MKWKNGIPSDAIVEDAPASGLGFKAGNRMRTALEKVKGGEG